jgi:ubiquinone/menaquinone biosynthesis C-methylase UbiE
MIENKSYTMVIGCGESGATWIAKKQNPKQEIIGLDIKQPKETNVPFIIGNVFYLPIKDNSIAKIHADFIINGFDLKFKTNEIFKNPDTLDTNNFPLLVKDWYIEKMHRSQNLVRDNIGEINFLLKIAVLRELWRVLETNGILEILDFARNVDWIKLFAYKAIQERPLLLIPKFKDITPEDFERSASLEKVFKGRSDVQKIELTKLPTPPVNESTSDISN